MTNVSEWSVAAGSNNNAPPDGWPENMLPGKVNDCARENMAALARWYKDQNASLTTAGTTTAYTLTTNCVYTSLTDIALLVFRTHAANTGAVTLAVDGLGAKPLRKDGSLGDYASGEITSGQTMVVTYNVGTDDFEVVGPTIALATALAAVALLKASNLSDVANAVTAFTNIKQAATTAATGVAELATTTETKARTSSTVVVTPDGLSDFARIKTGTYTGDSTLSQAITGVGFRPKYVKIAPHLTGDDTINVWETWDVVVDDQTGGQAIGYLDSGGVSQVNDRIVSLDADGFTVGDDSTDGDPNSGGVVYNYLAIG